MQLKLRLYLVLLLASCGVQAQEIISLKQAYEMALMNNFSIQVAKNDQAIAATNNSPGAAGMLPVISGTAGQDKQVMNTRQTFLNGTENNKNAAQTTTLNAGVEMSWTIFNGMKMFAARNRLQELEAIGKERLKMQMELVLSRVAKAYFDAVLAKKELKSAREFLEISRKRLEVAKAKVATGKSARSEELNAQVYFNTDYANLKKLETNYKNSKLSLTQLLSKEITFSFEVADSLLPDEKLSYEDLKSKAAEKNTGVKISKLNRDVNQNLVKEVRGDRFPGIALKSGYNFNQSKSQAGFLQSSMNNGYHFGAGLTMNLFNGNDVNRRMQNAKLTLLSSDYSLKDSILKLEIAITQSYNTYSTTIELYHFEQENLKVAEKNFEIARDQYDQGIISLNDLREAQVNLLQSINRMQEAAYNAKLSEIELLRLSGQLVN